MSETVDVMDENIILALRGGLRVILLNRKSKPFLS